jgi:hypothetical protein
MNKMAEEGQTFTSPFKMPEGEGRMFAEDSEMEEANGKYKREIHNDNQRLNTRKEWTLYHPNQEWIAWGLDPNSEETIQVKETHGGSL